MPFGFVTWTAVLFDGLVSPSLAEADATSHNGPADCTLAVMLTFELPPAGSAPIEQVTVVEAGVQPAPALTKVAPTGSVSTSETAVASLGPLLVTVAVYWTLDPCETGLFGACASVTARSTVSA